MKKSIYLLGMAVAALSSCSQSDVVEMPESRAIGFSSFVNNNVRDVQEEASGTLSGAFYVFTRYGGNNENNFTSTAHNNEPSTAIHYWTASQDYRFGAYKNGTTKLANAEFTPAASASVLKFPGYTPDDQNDLIAAFGEATTSADVTGQGKVGLDFKHLLSQVKFTFTTDATAVYNLTISEVKITNAISKSTCTYTAGTPTIVWDGTGVEGVESNGYIYEDFTSGKAISIENPASQSKLVIPQSGTDAIKVTFKAKVDGAGITMAEAKDFEGYLAYEDGDDTWNPGFRYNYSVKINVKDIVDSTSGLVIIEFTPTVDPWEDEQNTNVTPNKVP